MRVPLVGVTCDHATFIDARGAPDSRHQLAQAYVHALAAAGAAAVLLPHQAPELAAGCLRPCDALVVSGGDTDVPPEFYGQVPRPGLGRIVAARSAFERALLLEAWRRRLPTLGVCGGMQVQNVVAGGSLVQDLDPAPGALDHQQPHDRRRPHHRVRLLPGSLLSRCLAVAGDEVEVNSTHHQAVDRLGEGLVAAAVAPDGAIEAIEATQMPFWLGVQWHPEVLGPPTQWRLYASLVAAARACLAAGSVGFGEALETGVLAKET